MGSVVNLRSKQVPESRTLVRRTGRPSIEAINNLTEVDRAWMAGFFDGEGSIGLYRKFQAGRFYAVTTRVTMAQTGNEQLIPFFEAFGGSLVLIDRPDRRTARHTQYWTWTCDAVANASLFLQTVVPYMRLKKAEAELLLHYVNNVYSLSLEQKGEIIDRLAVMKQRVETHILDERRDKLRSIATGE